ncbi:MAG: MFS transporter [Elusimicrobiales bacterium]
MSERARIPSGIWILSSCNALLTTGYSLSVPFFSIYLSVERNVPMSVTGAFLAFSIFISSAGMGVGGEVSDALGRRRVMLFSLAARGIIFALMAAGIYFNIHYVWLVLLHVCGSFMMAGYAPAAQAWVADNFDPRRRLEFFGLLRIGTNLGWALGPMLGGFASPKAYPLMFAVTSAVYGIGTAIMFFTVPESLPGTAAKRAHFGEMLLELRDARLARLCVVGFIICTAMSQLVVGLSLFCARYLGYPQHSIGLFFSINGFAVVFLQQAAAKLAARTRISSAMAVGSLLYMAGYATVGFSSVFLWTAAGVFILSLGELFIAPGLQTLGSNIAPAEKRGRYLGIQGLAQQLGAAFGIFLGGANMEQLAPIWRQGPWMLIALIAFCAAIGFYGMRKHLTPEEDGLRNPAANELVL